MRILVHRGDGTGPEITAVAAMSALADAPWRRGRLARDTAGLARLGRYVLVVPRQAAALG